MRQNHWERERAASRPLQPGRERENLLQKARKPEGSSCQRYKNHAPSLPAGSENPGRRCSAHNRSSGPVQTPSGCVRLSAQGRSEEHTSELQSQFHLVCRLLLEKKKKKKTK